MMRKFLSGVFLVIVITLTACGPKAAPALSVADIQNTALAVAMTNIGMTQSAVPTNTAIAPTPIPVTAIPTLETLPTSAIETPIVAPPGNSNASPTPDCYQPPPEELLGTTVSVRFVNESGGPVDLSMGMYAPNDRGECFTFAFFVGTNLSEDVTVLAGCYWIAGYQNGPQPSTPRVNYICLEAFSGRYVLQINANTIGFPE